MVDASREKLRESISTIESQKIDGSSASSLATSGPYIRVYDRQTLQQPDTISITLDIPRNKKRTSTTIKVPHSMTKITIDQDNSYTRNGSGTPQTLILSRPKPSSTPKYSRSTASLSMNSHRVVDPSQILLPFQILTNSLKLYFQLKVLSQDEQILSWQCGSIVKQKPGLIQTRLNMISKLFNNRSSDKLKIFPAYLLLTTKHLYIYKPSFSLQNLNQPLRDEQISYQDDPSKLLILSWKFDLMFNRIDVGPGRQYLVFHSNLQSLVFLTRSRQLTTTIVDHLKTIYHDIGCESVINQNIEYCVRNLQDLVLLRPGKKSVNLFSSGWTCNEVLSDKEFDNGINELVTKVDFEFVKFYFLSTIIRIIQPVKNVNSFGADITPISLLCTNEYLYIVQEQLDIWPPSIFPFEFGIKSIGDTNSKGFLIDNIQQHRVLGVGRIHDIVMLECWKSWRIDSSYGEEVGQQFQGLGKALRNGHIGYFRTREKPSIQQGTTSGWLWWVRVSFKIDVTNSLVREPPKSVPTCGYFWDVVYSSKESLTEFVEGVHMLAKRLDPNAEILIIDPED